MFSKGDEEENNNYEINFFNKSSGNKTTNQYPKKIRDNSTPEVIKKISSNPNSGLCSPFQTIGGDK